MLLELMEYFNSSHHTIKKEDVLNNLENTMNGINDDIIPGLESVISSISDIKSLEDDHVLKNIAYGSDIKSKDSRDTIVKIKGIFTNIVKSNKDLTKVIDNDLPEIVTDKSATVRDMAIIKLVSDISSMTMYTLDIIYYILAGGSTENSTYPKIKFKTILDGLGSYNSGLKTYGSNFSKTVNKLSDVATVGIIGDVKKLSMLEKVVNKNGKSVKSAMTSGFNGNPIYRIRMRLVDREVTKYEELKDKKKLIDLKLMELKLKDTGEENPKLKQEIEYYEEKISKMEYEITSTEDDYND